MKVYLMSYDIGKVIRYGVRIGAEQALIIDGTLSRYYKKGDIHSKHCAYSYTDHKNGRPLRWENAYTYSACRSLEFYQNLGYSAELIDIPKELPAEGDLENA